MSADIIKGGSLTALNNAMSVNLNDGAIEFKTGNAALRRTMKQMPNQFIKFSTGFITTNASGVGVDCGVTIIGSNRDFSENSNNGTFTGIRIWNGFSDDIEFDSVDIIGDTVKFAESADTNYKSWIFKTVGAPSITLSKGSAAERNNSHIEAGDFWILQGTSGYHSLKRVLNTFNENFKQLGKNYFPGGF